MPCMALDLGNDLESLNVDELSEEARLSAQPGSQGLWLRDVPWGHEAMTAVYLRIVGAVGDDLPPFAVRRLGASKWPAIRMPTIVDCSDMLAEPLSPESIEDRVRSMRIRPIAQEIVVVDPHSRNVTPAVLDALFRAIPPEGGGWVYAKSEAREDHEEPAVKAVTACETVWGVRLRP